MDGNDHTIDLGLRAMSLYSPPVISLYASLFLDVRAAARAQADEKLMSCNHSDTVQLAVSSASRGEHGNHKVDPEKSTRWQDSPLP